MFLPVYWESRWCGNVNCELVIPDVVGVMLFAIVLFQLLLCVVCYVFLLVLWDFIVIYFAQKDKT